MNRNVVKNSIMTLFSGVNVFHVFFYVLLKYAIKLQQKGQSIAMQFKHIAIYFRPQE